MFLRGITKDTVLTLIKKTLKRPQKKYRQWDGRRVVLRTYKEPVGELVVIEEGGLSTTLIYTLKVVYTRERSGDIYIVTAYPLF